MRVCSFTTPDQAIIDVAIHGQGPALVILHGWTSGYQDWEQIVDQLGKHFTCYSWNARAYHDKQPTIANMAADAKFMMDYFELEHPILMGHSMGALTCWEHIGQFGDEHISKLIVIDQSPKLITNHDWSLGLYGEFTPDHNAEFVAELKANFTETVMNLIGKGKTLTDEQRAALFNHPVFVVRRQRVAQLNSTPWIDAWNSFVTKDYRHVLPKITVPTLLLYGVKSAFYGTQVAQYVRDHTPNAQLVMFEHSGHSPQVEEPEKFLQTVVNFCRTPS